MAGKLVRSGRGVQVLVMLAVAPAVLSGCAQLKTANSYGEKAKTIVVKSNMQLVQNAAEEYARDHTYLYPTAVDDDFKSYFENGNPPAHLAGHAPTNPFTGQGEWPVLGKAEDLLQARSAPPTPLQPGVIEYSPLNEGKSYAIRAGDEQGMAIAGEGSSKTLVISRDTYTKPTK
ncbi:MAG: hypothetical protein KC777_13750 [Cyanobacteria bacterium HKST-UBA02]|nr:hypothetical protein [Cyanobacteria bacterium HKST-UBA02]